MAGHGLMSAKIRAKLHYAPKARNKIARGGARSAEPLVARPSDRKP
jgi:hypothetical protein